MRLRFFSSWAGDGQIVKAEFTRLFDPAVIAAADPTKAAAAKLLVACCEAGQKKIPSFLILVILTRSFFRALLLNARVFSINH